MFSFLLSKKKKTSELVKFQKKTAEKNAGEDSSKGVQEEASAKAVDLMEFVLNSLDRQAHRSSGQHSELALNFTRPVLPLSKW